jgi:hypothetical protein
MDGSPAHPPPVELEETDEPTILTRERVIEIADVPRESLGASCIRERRQDLRPQAVLVERVGVRGESVTLRAGSRLASCDNSQGPREESRRWCGGSFGQLYRGRLRDPRLDIGCRTRRGEPMGFVWVEPREVTRYVAVEQPGYTEVYAVAGGLPVRVSTTSDVDIDRSSAVFQVSEHDTGGGLVRRYRLEAHVAG